MATAAGTLTGFLIWAGTAGLGLAALLAASRAGYDVVRIFGAAYLIWLGATSLMPRLRRSVHCDGRAGNDRHDSAPWLTTIVWMVSRGFGWLNRLTIQRRLEQLTGIVLIGFGIRLALGSAPGHPRRSRT